MLFDHTYRWPFVLLAWVVVSSSVSALDKQVTEETATRLLVKHCSRCHGNGRARGRFSLEALMKHPQGVRSSPKKLTMMLELVSRKEMPPKLAKSQPTREERAQLVQWMNHTLHTIQASNRHDPGRVIMPRLTRNEYLHVIRDLTGYSIDVKRYLPTDGGAGEGFTNVGEAQSISLSQIEKYLSASREVLSHLRASPVDGFHWYPTRQPDVSTARQRREEIIKKIVYWYGQQEYQQVGQHLADLKARLGMSHGAYWEALWRYRHRKERGEPTADFVSIARSYEVPLSAGILKKWHDVLSSDHVPSILDFVLRHWKKLPGPDEVDSKTVRAVCRQADRNAERLFGRKAKYRDWDYGPKYELTFRDAGGRARVRKLAQKEGRWPFTIQIGNAQQLHLVTTDAGDGNDNDLVIWRKGYFVNVAGKSIPWQDVLKDLPWGEHPKGARLEAGALAVRAPRVLVIQIPKGMKQFRVEAAVDRRHARNCSVQTLVLKDPPRGEDRHVYLKRDVWGDPGSKAVNAFIAGQAHARRMLTSRNRKGADNVLAKKTMLNAERNVLAPFTLVPHRYVGGPWPKQPLQTDRPDQPYFHLASSIRQHADSRARTRLDRLHKQLASAAQPTVQDLQWFLAEQGIAEPTEGVLPHSHVVAKWSEATRQQYHSLLVKLRKHESQLARIAEEQLTTFGLRAWRRPLTTSERKRLVELFQAERQQGASYDSAIKVPLRVILISPHFLYRHQHSRNAAKAYALSDYEVASRLSFFLWASIPDEELLRLARNGKLRDTQVLITQTRRMLRDPKARALATEFAGQWLGFAGFVDHTGPDPKRFPTFTPSLRKAMYDEAVLFFDDLFRQNRSLQNMIAADYVFVNEELANHYGIKGVSGTEMRKVRVINGQRGGVLGMGSILTRTSLPLRTSPVHRGVWVLEQLLGEHLPPPPPNIPPLSNDETNPKGLSIRAQLKLHRSKPSCLACHQRIDPLGISLEHYDPIGRWRTKERSGKPVGVSSQLSDGTRIAGVTGLRKHLDGKRDAVFRQFCRKFLGYALGRSISAGDQALLQQMQASLKKQNHRPGPIVELIVTSKQFLYRRDERTQPEDQHE